MRPGHNRFVLLRWGLQILAVVVLILANVPAWSASRPPSLRILSNRELPTDLSTPTSIRWAGDDSVYIARLEDGVAEVDLADLAVRRRVIADSKRPRQFKVFCFLGVSPSHMVVAATAEDIGIRRLGGQYEGDDRMARTRIGRVDGLDLSGSTILLLGMPAWDQIPKWAPTGTIAWMGPLTGVAKAGLWRPLLSDVAGPGAKSYTRCSGIGLGAARFLSDGSAVVVPGVQPGVHLYNAAGKPLRTWESEALGIDAFDCAGMTLKESIHIGGENRTRMAFVNAHHVVDDILPLPQGPGLAIRYVEDGRVHWLLKVLESGSRVLTYDVPITGNLPYARLSGDVRNGRIVLLVSDHGHDPGSPQVPGHLVLAELPGSKEGQ